MKKISAIIICLREEGIIQECLKSLNFVDEIVIINSGATSNTLEICKKFTDRIVNYPWPSYGLQMNYAMELIKNEWVLCLGVNEVVTDELRKSIIQAIGHDKGRYDGYRIKRQYFYSGRKINHCWVSESKILLYRKSKARWVWNNLHYSYSVDLQGKCRDLKGDLKYFPYQSVSQYLHTLDSLSFIASMDRFEKGDSISLSRLTFSPLLYFLRLYVYKRGFWDGSPGFIISVLESYYCFLESVKLWKMRNTSPTGLFNLSTLHVSSKDIER